MSLSQLLVDIASQYPSAVKQPFKEHPLASLIRNDLVAALKGLIEQGAAQYLVKGSAGQGRWSESPWAAVMNPVVTDSAEGGYYPVYLFSGDFSKVSFVMGQGTYDIRREFGREGPEILRMRGTLLRKRVPEYANNFSEGPFPIKSSSHAGGDWETASAWGKTYVVNEMPSDG